MKAVIPLAGWKHGRDEDEITDDSNHEDSESDGRQVKKARTKNDEVNDDDQDGVIVRFRRSSISQ